MLLYRDVYNGDELLSDSFPVKEIENGLILEVTAKRVTVEALDIGIENNAEDDGGLDDQARTVINVVDAFRLVETAFDKKGFMSAIKAFMKRTKLMLEKENPDRVEAFTQAAPGFVKKLLSKFDEYQFFMGESCDPQSNIVLLWYLEDGVTPMLWYFKDALKVEKC